MVYCLHFKNLNDYFASTSMLESSFEVAIIHIIKRFHGHFYFRQVLEIIIHLLLGEKSFRGTATLICNHGFRQYNIVISHYI